MRLIASDLITAYRPSPCSLRVYLRSRGEREAEPSEFDKLLRRLGQRLEAQRLATIGAHVDLSGLPFDERVDRTIQAVCSLTPTIYQAALRAETFLNGSEVLVVGMPDSLILNGTRYTIQDCKLALNIDEENHPEILLQVQLYGWLFEQTFGSQAALEVFTGRGATVTIPYDGGFAALANLQQILTTKQLAEEPYEPVGWTKCGGCGFAERCWKIAEANQDTAIIPDIDQNLARELHNQQVRTIPELLSKFDAESLAAFKRPVGGRLQKVGRRSATILMSAEALHSGKERVLEKPEIPNDANFVMFDLEGMPPHLNELEKIYLWGVQVFGDKPSRFMSATAGFGDDGDKQGWLDFLKLCKDILEEYGDVRFVHWSAYEKTQISKYMTKYGDLDGVGERVKHSLLDLFPICKKSMILPVPSYSLKLIEKYVGFERTQDEYGGDWAMATFIEATETDDEAKRQELMSEILRYNEEDLHATWAVLQWLKSKSPAPQAAHP